MPSKFTDDDAEIIERYQSLSTIEQIGKDLHWSPNFVRNRLIDNGIKLRPKGGSRPTRHDERWYLAKELYKKHGSTTIVAEMMGVKPHTILRWLDKVDQPRSRRKEKCKNGHPMVEKNTVYEHGGHRRCLRCKNESNRRYMARRRAKAASETQ